MSIISMILVVIVAFLAGIEGVVDEFQFHQPLVACTLIGLVTGNLEAGIVLGGSLQMIALGWANIGAAVAPDAALASVASAIILVLGGQGVKGVSTAIAVAIPLAVAGLFLTMVVRTLSVACVHRMDAEAEKANFKGIELWHIIAICLQGLRIAIPAACLLAIPTETVQNFLQSMPAWLTDGMSIGGGMVVAVGYAMVINMIATKEVWPFFAIGFCLAAISDLTLIALGAIALAIAFIYINLSENGGNGNGGGNVGDPVFWFTARPRLGALGASLAMGGSILGPILFFVLWNVIRWAFMWYTQEFGYRAGSKISEDLSGGLLQKVTKIASILGMFVLGSLIERWVSINFTPVVSKVTLSEGAYIDWKSLPAGAEGIKTALSQYASGMALDPTKITTLQDNLNSLIPGLMPLLLTLLCMWLLKKKVSPIVIILALFVVGILGHVVGIL